jgi:hypothetical protein
MTMPHKNLPDTLYGLGFGPLSAVKNTFQTNIKTNIIYKQKKSPTKAIGPYPEIMFG